MTLQKPGSNTLIDQIFLGQMVDEINTLSNKFSQASSSIFNTSTKKPSLTYFGGFAFATIQKEITQTLNKNQSTRYTDTFSFGKAFDAPPLVFATIECDAITGAGSTASTLLNGVVLSNINTGGGTFSVNLEASTVTVPIKYRINILAIGIPAIAPI